MRRERARAEIEQHLPADEVEAGHRRDMLSLLGSGLDAFSRSLFEPGHFTASGFVLSPSGGEVLLVHHASLGRWLQPGGHVEEEDEDFFSAAVREVEEETGVACAAPSADWPMLLDLDVHHIPARPQRGEPAHAHFDVRVLLRASAMDLRVGAGVLGAAWVGLDRVAAVETDASVRRAVSRIHEVLGRASSANVGLVR